METHAAEAEAEGAEEDDNPRARLLVKVMILEVRMNGHMWLAIPLSVSVVATTKECRPTDSI